jgi:choline-sulfatase
MNEADARKSKPNVILIVSDQHRGDWMGCAGNRFVHTPNMDRMARGGIRFSRAYCNSPLCVPSRMSMLTGLYPHQNDVFTNSDTLRSDLPTFAHAMGLAGYETVLCGRMHFVGPDQRHGFQKRLVGDITHCYLGGPRTDYGALAGASGQGLKSIVTAGPGHSPVLDYDEQVVAECERFLSARANVGLGPDECAPLFLTVGFYGPHHPYVCPQAVYDRARQAMEAADSPQPPDETPLHPWYEQWFARLKARQITAEQLTAARTAYAGLITLTDSYIGRILEAAKRLPGDTWVVYISDHGDMAGDRGMFWKRNMLEGAIRVPMIWYPLKREGDGGNARLAEDIEIDAPVSLLDLAPTLAGIAQAPPLPHQEGSDLTPLIFGVETPDADKWRKRPVFAELANPQDGVLRAVVRDGMKLIYFAGYDRHLLFDLKRDPRETTNLWDDPAYADIRRQLTDLVRSGDWDARQIGERLRAREANQQYLTQWGKQVGMGPSDLWNQAVSRGSAAKD